jgi:hypothetical protein
LAKRSCFELFCFGALCLAEAGCTNVTRLGVGPVAAYPSSIEDPSYGDAFLFRGAIGTSDFTSVRAAEYETRLLVTEETQAFSLGVGYLGMRWLGPGMLMLSATPALGVERCRGKPLGNAGLHGGFGMGIALAESRWQRPGWNPLPEHYRLASNHYVRQDRKRTLLTLELVGSVDVRGTREPLLMTGLLVGLAFTHESREVEIEPPVPPAFEPFLGR